MLPSPPPLRTARDTFASSSSSLSDAPFRTRFHFWASLAVNLLMAGRMEQHAVLELVATTLRSPDLVLVVPPCQLGNPLMTTRTKSFLLFPEGQYLPFSPQRVFHFHAEAFLARTLPRRGRRDWRLPGAYCVV